MEVRTNLPKGITFKYTWRGYQKRVLEELNNHLLDQHLHIVAPPGSGKTVLGLEAVIRINEPCLILAPTLAIRNQWIQRFCELFLQTNVAPDWISRDIRNPKFMTVVTYQGLHAACNKIENDDDVFKIRKDTSLKSIANGLRQQNVSVFVVDEAHHLKNEWWRTLSLLKKELTPKIIGLTATPPYDVTPQEWQRYIELNGPVDAEISVPELVEANDLCPHQDFIHFTIPSQAEKDSIIKFRERIANLFDEIKQSETIISAIQNHFCWQDPLSNLEWIYQNLPFYSASLIYLKANNIEIPSTHVEIVGDEKTLIPSLDYSWMETLLDFYLISAKNDFKNYNTQQTELENRLRRYGAIDGKKINFTYNARLGNSLSLSISKIEGIRKIVEFEYQNLRQDLRLVILSDYIRKEYFPNSTENNLEIKKLGVMPIFEYLRRTNNNNKKIAVLTGSLVIIPATAEAELIRITKNYNIHFKTSTVNFDSNYLIVQTNEQSQHHLVHIVTQVFQSGEIEILIGTKSLLGEGWDSPNINALILASFVGSFVLSNQMRGRAIRTQKENPIKTSNIWHLACVDPTLSHGGEDLKVLHRRFRTFVGLSHSNSPQIENGLNRLGIDESFSYTTDLQQINNAMFEFASDRSTLRNRWQEGIQKGVSLVEEIKIPFQRQNDKDYEENKTFYLYRSISYLASTLGIALTAYLEFSFNIMAKASNIFGSAVNTDNGVMAIGGLGILFFGGRALKTFNLYTRYRDISKDLYEIGQVVLRCMIKTSLIQSDPQKVKVLTYADRYGATYCHLDGASSFEKSTFIQLLDEIVGEVKNPRYIIIRKGKLFAFLQHKDYHTVPEMFARNKKTAEYFAEQWKDYVGNCQLIFTRTIDGRKIILKARIKSLAAQFAPTEHVNMWR